MLSIGQVKLGTKIIFRAAPHQAILANHLNLGRGQAKLITKLKNLITGAIVDQTFSGNERIEEATVTYHPSQFLYSTGQTGQFMTDDTFEQLSYRLEPNQAKFLREGQPVSLTIWNDQVIEIVLPKKVELKVTYTEPGIKGDTTGEARKSATLESGATIQVPLFIHNGQTVVVNTETGQYDSRV